MRGDENARYKLILYDLSTREIAVVESARYRQGSWFIKKYLHDERI